jgi:hypothetical protein
MEVLFFRRLHAFVGRTECRPLISLHQIAHGLGTVSARSRILVESMPLIMLPQFRDNVGLDSRRASLHSIFCHRNEAPVI